MQIKMFTIFPMATLWSGPKNATRYWKAFATMPATMNHNFVLLTNEVFDSWDGSAVCDSRSSKRIGKQAFKYRTAQHNYARLFFKWLCRCSSNNWGMYEFLMLFKKRSEDQRKVPTFFIFITRFNKFCCNLWLLI